MLWQAAISGDRISNQKQVHKYYNRRYGSPPLITVNNFGSTPVQIEYIQYHISRLGRPKYWLINVGRMLRGRSWGRYRNTNMYYTL